MREKKGISQEVVSSFAGIGRTHLSAIERGQRKPTLETFFRLSEALGLSASDIMREIETKAWHCSGSAADEAALLRRCFPLDRRLCGESGLKEKNSY